MADGKRGAGKGAYTENGVVCTMGAPFSKAMSGTPSAKGTDGRNKAPFDKPQSMGNGGITTRFFDDMSEKAANTVNASMTGTAGANRTAPVGTRRFKNPGSNT